LKRI
jgi:hypothetical protein